jgi:hypothetical protein
MTNCQDKLNQKSMHATLLNVVFYVWKESLATLCFALKGEICAQDVL